MSSGFCALWPRTHTRLNMGSLLARLLAERPLTSDQPIRAWLQRSSGAGVNAEFF